MLLFSHLYSSKFATDGGYILIRDTSAAPGVWDSNGITTWKFTQGNYVDQDSLHQPAVERHALLLRRQLGWQNIPIELSTYAGKSIQINSSSPSSSSISGNLSAGLGRRAA